MFKLQNAIEMSGARPDWRHGDYYKSLLTLDRRRWAWLWLKRNHNYQAGLKVAADAQWQSLGQGRHRLIQQDLASLF